MRTWFYGESGKDLGGAFYVYMAEESGGIPQELTTPNYRVTQLKEIGYDKDWMRQDPSNVIRLKETYYIWYAKYKPGTPGYAARIAYATSADGLTWSERGWALNEGDKQQWDSYGVVAPYMAVVDGKYYLFYNGTSADKHPWIHEKTLRHTGVAIAESPDGPFKRFSSNPIFSPGPDGAWDSLLVTDPHVIVRDGKYWLYYKGLDPNRRLPSKTRWGLATAEKITGPYVRCKDNPITDSGHTVCVWPHRRGVAALVDGAGPNRHTVQYAGDGIHFRVVKRQKFVHTGCAPYDPSAFAGVAYGPGITWGVAQESRRGRNYIVRFDVDLDVDLTVLPKPERDSSEGASE